MKRHSLGTKCLNQGMKRLNMGSNRPGTVQNARDPDVEHQNSEVRSWKPEQ